MRHIKDAFAGYSRDGYQIPKRYREIVNIDPSSASLMLSEDFDLSIWEKALAKIKRVR